LCKYSRGFSDRDIMPTYKSLLGKRKTVESEIIPSDLGTKKTLGAFKERQMPSIHYRHLIKPNQEKR
jgi:hypothetical protein